MSGYYDYAPLIEKGAGPNATNKPITPWIDATVPGSIYCDLLNAGLIEDPLYEMNSLKCEWVAQRWWCYLTYFDYEKSDERAELVFEGIDCKAHVLLNDEIIGCTDNMFVPLVCDITDKAKSGKNKLSVIIEYAPEEQSQLGKTSLTRTQKSRFNYKWDFCTRLVGMGIYRPVYLKRYKKAKIGSYYFRPLNTQGDAEITVSIVGEWQGCVTSVEIGKKKYTALGANVRIPVRVDGAKLWWPNGEGPQNLYDLHIRVTHGNELCDSLSAKVGFKILELTKNDEAPENAAGYVYKINGRKIYIKGVNITPLDITNYAKDEKYEALVAAVKEANVNLIRVWGGGVIESEYFYRLCDENGILVYQEFVQSGSGTESVPSKDAEFLKKLKDTAEYACKTLRNHVSLAVWSGGNELTDEFGVPVTFEDENIRMLQKIVQCYCPDIPMFPSCGNGPSEHLNVEKPGGNHDVHGPWQYLGPIEYYSMFNKSDSLFHSEFGCPGMSDFETLKKFLSDENLCVTNCTDNLVWRHHGEWWDVYFQDSEIFGEPRSLRELIKFSQFLQGEGIRYAVEANRRRAFKNGGSIVWQLNECFPNVSCTSLLDYYGNKKPAYYSLMKAYARLNVSLRYHKLIYEPGETINAEIFVISDDAESEIEYSCEYRAHGTEEKVCGTCITGNGKPIKVGEIAFCPDRPFADIKLMAENSFGKFENTVKFFVKDKQGKATFNEEGA